MANYGGFDKDLSRRRLACTGIVWGARLGTSRPTSGSCRTWRRHRLQFTSGTVDEDGYVLATNCYCFYTDDRGPVANPTGALWRVLPADKVPAGAEVAKTK